jgi:hypothetical protein
MCRVRQGCYHSDVPLTSRALRRDSSIFFCIASCFSGVTKGWYVTSIYSVPYLPSSCKAQLACDFCFHETRVEALAAMHRQTPMLSSHEAGTLTGCCSIFTLAACHSRRAPLQLTALRAFLAAFFFLLPGTRGFSFFICLGPCRMER